MIGNFWAIARLFQDFVTDHDFMPPAAVPVQHNMDKNSHTFTCPVSPLFKQRLKPPETIPFFVKRAEIPMIYVPLLTPRDA
jgi:hypothetical protein